MSFSSFELWPLLPGAAVALVAGLDRMALGQVMLCRPLVCAPVAGWLLGVPEAGLLVGALTELVWLGRLPVGAAIPPDDTQVAIGATTLTALLADGGDTLGALPLFCLLLAIPLGKVGQWFDHWARRRNDRLPGRVEAALKAGRDRQIERLHLRGLVHFAQAGLMTYLVIALGGYLVAIVLLPIGMPLVGSVRLPVELALPLVGAAVLIATLNVSRALTLFGASFLAVYLAAWVF
ncbi:PTS system mannose-specific IIC component [Geothermobacter ehrlichii]|uniref:PTS system mannose-specific IIC component n=1 Tax=Geothermobacter ehrlichii TaxID=213224 RepID=A0A5D3WME1_9BACT|nr:PTS sugar transporter subunit IIC [Geothermobacter ehrlichii]TYO99516.1 PTS system mannose-specific IIC component [Geothermobacter ehrlichii]